MTRYNYYFAKKDEDGYFHNNRKCEQMTGDVWGDMTEGAAIDAMRDESDYDACPECVDL